MNIQELHRHLDGMEDVSFRLPDGTFVPQHFHITEAGLATKHFIDCGGTVRTEKYVSLQLWTANDIDHRLEPKKLKRILTLAGELFNFDGLDIEVEYQQATIGRFALDISGDTFVLASKQTDCLAQDSCGTPVKQKLQLPQLPTNETSCCTPGGGCC